MRSKALCFSVVLLSGSLLLSTAAAAEQVIYETTTKQVIVREAVKLPPQAEVKKTGQGISEEEALKILRGTFPEITTEGQPDIRLDYDSFQGRNIWRIDNYKRMRYGPGMPAGYHASLDADTGEILNINWHNNPSGEAKGIIQRQEAQKTAEQLVKRLQPERFKHLQLQKSTPEHYLPLPNLNIVHRFNWARVENGIKIDYDGIGVSVDALTGQVTSYDLNWRPEVKLPPAGTPVPARELNEKAVNELGMALVYQVPYRNYGVAAPEAKLVYQVNARELIFNANTGKAVDYQGKEKEIQDLRMFENLPKAAGVNNPPSSSGQRVTVEKAGEAAKKFFRLLGIEGEVERGGSGSSGGPLGEQEYWSFNIASQDKSRHYPGPQVGIDVRTGQVVNYHEFMPEVQSGEKSTKISREEALAKASEFIKKMTPEYSPSLVPEKSTEDFYGNREGDYYFHFARLVNGIPFTQDGIRIAISSDGKIIDYNCEWHKVSFPAAQNIITPEEAARKWLELSPLKLTYFFPHEGEKQSNQAILVYRPEHTGYSALDALTGNPVTYGGQPVNNTTVSGYDFKQSWASQYLEILAGSGILPPADQFSPVQPVKKRDAARLMAAAMTRYYGYDEKHERQFQDVNPDDPDFSAIQAGALQKVYDKGGNFNPDQPVTRLTLARWMVNAMGYGDVAKINNTIASSYKDISSLPLTDRNYIGLAQGLGIMQGDEKGRFKPSDNVTWEELAAVVINSAPKMRNKIGM